MNEVNKELSLQEDVDLAPIGDTELFYPSEGEQAQTGFTPMAVKEILTHIQLGATLSDCANIVRLPTRRVLHWYNKNYCNFRYSVDYCKAHNKRKLLKDVYESKNGLKVSSAKFMLERKHRDEYGKEIKVEVNHTMVDNVAKVTFEVATRHIKDPDELRMFIEDLAEEYRMIKGNEELPTEQRILSQ
jgi:hypothetical protein